MVKPHRGKVRWNNYRNGDGRLHEICEVGMGFLKRVDELIAYPDNGASRELQFARRFGC